MKGLLAGIAVSTAFTAPLPAQQFTTEEVQAALVFNAMQFVSWPEAEPTANSIEKITICTLGTGPLITSLDLLQGRKLNGYPTELKRLKRGSAISSVCEALAIGLSEANHTKNILSSVSSEPVFTISRLDGFATSGGILTLKKFGNRFQLIVNTTSSKNARLEISSQLLEVVQVIDTPLVTKGGA